jgi:U4/U6.U5 tri-snRNP-associated protein 2
MPIFKDSDRKSVIPQVSLKSLFVKFNNLKEVEVGSEIRKYKIIKLPRFLILHFKRLSKGRHASERNSTVVNFDTSLDITDIHPEGRYSLISTISHHSVSNKGGYKVIIDDSPPN